MSFICFVCFVFWVVTPCSAVSGYQRFRDPCCLHFHFTSLHFTSLHFILKMEGA